MATVLLSYWLRVKVGQVKSDYGSWPMLVSLSYCVNF